MGKKAREYKSGDFIFAKVKGYPAWPARVQRMNGKKYFVYFYGTGETANLPSNMIFDYAENKDKFLTKTQKRRDFNDGVKQIEHDFANKVPLEQVIGTATEKVAMDVPADDTANDSAINDTMDETVDTTAANDTADDDAIANTSNEAAVEDSDENGALVIDEGKAAKKKSAAKTPAKETPKAKETKTPRGKAKKDDKPEETEEDKDELVSRSGRKIRPKRYVDEQTEENSTLPSPAPKKRRGASPPVEKDKPEPKDKNIKSFNAVTQSELEELKQPFVPEDAEKENILIAYLPSGKYVGIKLFQSRPTSFKNESSRLQWDKQAASNAITLRMQLERDQITALSVQGQLVMDLNLTDEEKATLDKERETEEKKSRVQFLKTEMKLIELDAKIKTCLSLQKANTDLCLKLLDDVMELDIKPLMLLKHPTCLETIKRLRAYVGNTPSWDLSEEAAITFNRQAHRIRKQSDIIYSNLKELFTTPDGLSFWEYFSERVLHFKKVAAKYSGSELVELVHEPLEMTQPTSHTMKAAIDAANQGSLDDEPPKKKSTAAKSQPKKATNATPAKGKRQSNRKLAEEKNADAAVDNAETDKDVVDNSKEPEAVASTTEDAEPEANKDTEEQASDKESEIPDKPKESKQKTAKEGKKSLRNAEKNAKEAEKVAKEAEKVAKEAEKVAKQAEKVAKEAEKSANEAEIISGTENDKEAEENVNNAEATATNDDTTKDAENSQKDEEKPKEIETPTKSPKKNSNNREKSPRADKNAKDTEKNAIAEKSTDEPQNTDKDSTELENEDIEPIVKSPNKKTDKNGNNDKGGKDTDKIGKVNDKSGKDNDKSGKDNDKSGKDNDKSGKDNDKSGKDNDKSGKDNEKSGKDNDKSGKDNEKSGKDNDKSGKDNEKSGKDNDKRKIDDKAEDKKEESGEPRAKRTRETRESKKTEAPPSRSPAKRKSKY